MHFTKLNRSANVDELARLATLLLSRQFLRTDRSNGYRLFRSFQDEDRTIRVSQHTFGD